MSYEQERTRKRAAVGAATKKESRGWEDHEKVLVKKLMQQVILEGTHARTEVCLFGVYVSSCEPYYEP